MYHREHVRKNENTGRVFEEQKRNEKVMARFEMRHLIIDQRKGKIQYAPAYRV
jgi:hypothetical protein